MIVNIGTSELIEILEDLIRYDDCKHIQLDTSCVVCRAKIIVYAEKENELQITEE